MNSVDLQKEHMKLRGNGGGNREGIEGGGETGLDLIKDITCLQEISKQLKKKSLSFQISFFFKELNTSCLRARNKLISYQGLDLAE